MNYQSIEEICKEFNLDSSLNEEELIDELIKLQKKLHPDVNPNFSESDLKMFTKADMALDFLRAPKEQTMVPVSAAFDLIKSFFKNKTSTIEYEESLTEIVSKSSERIVKNVKDYYFPKKIYVISFAVLISIIGLLIIWMANSRFFSEFFSFWVEYFYLILIIFWFTSLMMLFLLFMRIIKREFWIKSILTSLSNTDLQFEILNSFVSKRNIKDPFTKDEIEKYINEYIYEFFNRSSIKKLYPYIKEISPKVAELIIFRALEKGFIIEMDGTWNDKYIVKEEMFFYEPIRMI